MKRKFLSNISFVYFIIGLMGISAEAVIIDIQNHGFEDYVLNDEYFTRPFGPGGHSIVESDPIPGWILSDPYGDGGTFNPSISSYLGEAPEGQNVAYSSLITTSPTISQILSDVLTANTIYTLTILVGNRLDSPYSGYAVQLLAGGNLLSEDYNFLNPQAGEFVLSTVEFYATDSNPYIGEFLEIRLLTFNGGQTNFDDVQLNAEVIPEPATIILFSMGAGFVGWMRKKRAI